MIELKHVYAGYDGKEVLHDISAVFLPGTVTAVIGPNGCGKSTLLKTIVRINAYHSGEILVDGERIESYKQNELVKKLAYLAQSKHTPDISVLRMVLHGRFPYLSYPRKYRKEDIEAAKQALKWIGMEEFSEENMNRLSGGMQQKVYLAMALAQNAETILMDEPTTYLDISHQLRVMELARELAAETKAVVMVLHDLSQALRTADHVIVMQEGRIVSMGTPEQVYQSGRLQEVFGVELTRVESQDKKFYICDAVGKGDDK